MVAAMAKSDLSQQQQSATTPFMTEPLLSKFRCLAKQIGQGSPQWNLHSPTKFAKVRRRILSYFGYARINTQIRPDRFIHLSPRQFYKLAKHESENGIGIRANHVKS